MPVAVSDNDHINLQKNWESVLGLIEIQIGNRADFDAYLEETKAKSMQDGVLTVTAKNGFVAAWINQKVKSSLDRLATQVFGFEVKIEIETMAYVSSDVLVREGLAGDYSEWADVHLNRQKTALARDNAAKYPTLRDLTFDSFLRSECNAKAMDAALKVVEGPGTAFNPLTITAETGQGKTHLINAIANRLRENGENVVYLNGEEFVNQFVNETRRGTVGSLRDRYRGADALLVDGIERLAGRTGTLTFFLNLVEYLMSNQKQLVVTFNSAYAMERLGEEITSRLSGGLEIAIDPPDRELKRSVWLRRIAERKLPVDAGIIEDLIDRPARTVREILGGFARVEANYSLGHAAQSTAAPAITRAFVDDALRDRLAAPSPLLLSPETVLDAVATVFEINSSDLRKPGRGSRSVNSARDLAIYVIRNKCGLTTSETGNLMGGRPHSTVLASLNRYSERRKSDQQLAEAERRVERLLN